MEAAAGIARVRLIIEGRVQGVYFRASAVQEARRLRLTGWVMNCQDGSVQIVAEGPAETLDELIVWCRHGPPGARVHRVDVRQEDCRSEFADFRIRN
jgi:acylphosphatase